MPAPRPRQRRPPLRTRRAAPRRTRPDPRRPARGRAEPPGPLQRVRSRAGPRARPPHRPLGTPRLRRVSGRRRRRHQRRSPQRRSTAAAAPGQDPPDTAASRAAAREVARALVGSGVLDDAAYAAGRARSLARAGRSRRAISAHLSQKGVPQEVAQAALPEPEAELAAALAYARRRRLGPFRRDPPDGADLADIRRKETGAMARAGFPQPVAMQALRMDRDAAEQAVIGLKQS